MTIEERVNELLEFIKDRMKEMRLDASDVFMNGNCGNLYTIFANYFRKEAVVPYEILYRGEPYHIITKIGEGFYDISGKTYLEKYMEYLNSHNSSFRCTENDLEMREIGIEDRKSRISKQSDMYDYDEDWNQSLISGQMYKLDRLIEEFKKSREK